MKITLTLESGKETIDIPNWGTITLGQFQDLQGIGADPVAQLSALTGKEYGVLNNAKANVLIGLLRALRELNQEPDLNFKMPTELLGVEIPKKVGSLALGQTLLVYQKFLEGELGALSYAIAVYLQPQLDGEFDREKALKLEGVVRQLPLKETYPVGNFFLRKLRRLIAFGILRYSLIKILSMNKEGWRLIGLMVRSYRSSRNWKLSTS